MYVLNLQASGTLDVSLTVNSYLTDDASPAEDSHASKDDFPLGEENIGRYVNSSYWLYCVYTRYIVH